MIVSNALTKSDITRAMSQQDIPAHHPQGEQVVTVGQLEQMAGSPFIISENELVGLIVSRFESEPDLSGAIVTNSEGDKIICVISRVALSHRMARGHFKDLFLKRPISHMLPVWEPNVLELPAWALIHEAIDRGLSRPPAFRYEPVTVLKADDSRFLLDLHILLTEQCRALSSALKEVDRSRQTMISAQRERDLLNERLLAASRQAGMAEVATSVLHNVGNVLNSVTVSTSVISQKMRESKVANLGKAMGMLQEHQADLSSFLCNDEKGRQLPGYLAKLTNVLATEHNSVLEEISALSKSVEHIQHIVTSQQAFASGGVIKETFQLADAVTDALRINALALNRHGVKVIEDYDMVAPVRTDKHKVLQILVNVINNAKKAVRDSEQAEKTITIRIREITQGNEPFVRLEVTDNGVGITAEHLNRIFTHGFTTRIDGHGFGLHGAANDARQMGGYLSAESAGAGQGATFRLLLPLKVAEAKVGT